MTRFGCIGKLSKKPGLTNQAGRGHEFFGGPSYRIFLLDEATRRGRDLDLFLTCRWKPARRAP